MATRRSPALLLTRALSRGSAPQRLRFFTTSSATASFARLPARPSPLFRRLHKLRWKSDKTTTTTPPRQRPDPTPHLGSPEPAPSLSQRLKKLSREYGWTAVGVYFALSALDFPFCFLAVRMLGTDRIGRYEEAVINAFWRVVRIPFPNAGRQPQLEGAPQAAADADDDLVEATAREGHLGWSGEVDRAAAKNRGAEATLWTQLALAYAIHKSFIFLRVPLTAAVLPKVVKTLRGWGYNIGKRKPKAP